MYYFFFQAEDGIRDTSVTGVQTCALPIFLIPERFFNDEYILLFFIAEPVKKLHRFAKRSEERRVGKECRCRWGAYHRKKNEMWKCDGIVSVNGSHVECDAQTQSSREHRVY